ncbi:MAG: hypothetical protein AAF696_18955 [Bacteroidota bacterium]
MKKYRSLLFLSLVLLFSVPIFQSCEEGVISPQDHAVSDVLGNANGFFDLQNSLEDSMETAENDCFIINYPVSVSYPDGTTSSYASEDALEAAIDSWLDNNPNSNDWPELVFPISVTLADGSIMSINNDEELCDLHFECYDEEYDIAGSLIIWETYGSFIDSVGCFDLAYPIDVIFPDSSVQTVNSNQELAQLCEDYWDNNPNASVGPSFVYPIQATTDSGTVSVNNDDELFDLLLDCIGDEFGEDGWIAIDEEFEFDEEEWEELSCFQINYPADIRFPDETTQTVNDENEVELAIDAWLQANPNSEAWPVFVFPLTVTLDNGSTQTVNSDEELCELYYSCWNEVFGD